MKIKTPIIVINFKTYESATGRNAATLSKICEHVARKTKSSIAVCPQFTDIQAIAKTIRIPVFAQHIDSINHGSHTGWVLPEAIKDAGAAGTLINHSEHRLPFGNIKAAVERAKALKLVTILCAKDAKEASALAKLKPDFIAYEPPELIGGTISVSTAKPDVIKKAHNAVKKNCKSCKLLVGAGVHTSEDVRISINLGADGVLLASGITMAKDKKKVLMDLISGMK